MSHKAEWSDEVLVGAHEAIAMGFQASVFEKDELLKARKAVLDRLSELRRQLSEMQRIVNEGH